MENCKANIDSPEAIDVQLFVSWSSQEVLGSQAGAGKSPLGPLSIGKGLEVTFMLPCRIKIL